jgi:hypothetical protein
MRLGARDRVQAEAEAPTAPTALAQTVPCGGGPATVMS